MILWWGQKFVPRFPASQPLAHWMMNKKTEMPAVYEKSYTYTIGSNTKTNAPPKCDSDQWIMSLHVNIVLKHAACEKLHEGLDYGCAIKLPVLRWSLLCDLGFPSLRLLIGKHLSHSDASCQNAQHFRVFTSTKDTSRCVLCRCKHSEVLSVLARCRWPIW